MKRILLAAAMTISASAFANMCEVDMVDNRTNRLITTFRANDMGDDCKEGMKQCRKEIRLRGLLDIADCVRATVNYPNPGPIGTVDARRMISNGESAIMGNRYVTVMGPSFHGMYTVRSADGWNTITNNVRRESLSVTNGCTMNLCTSDSVIDINSARYVTVVGISFDERIVTRSADGRNTLASGVDRRNLAVTEQGACAYSRFGGQICVGNQVINNMNRYSTVVGIQLDGNVVLRLMDGWNTLTANIDPLNLVITK